MTKERKPALIPPSLESIPDLVRETLYVIRGQKVMLDSDLARLYGVPTKRLNEQVTRNLERFPAEFMFRLMPEEAEALRSQFATSKSAGHGGRRYPPRAFTEQGVAMLSSVLRSDRAVQINIAIIRAFVALRAHLADVEQLALRLTDLESRTDRTDVAMNAIFEELENLRILDVPETRRIGFGSKRATQAR